MAAARAQEVEAARGIGREGQEEGGERRGEDGSHFRDGDGNMRTWLETSHGFYSQ